tara:strand:+ start:3676 stop:4935 length:1260 start_codon:yes stop_codon:yes gene_type:complete
MAGKNKFKAVKGRSSHPYGDPTYLSFFFTFDWGYGIGNDSKDYDKAHSPLFLPRGKGGAEDYLRDFCGDEDRADDLVKFKEYLQKINKNMPWFFQSISGLESAHDYGKFDEPYRGVDKKMTVKCLETVDFTMNGLIDLYKNICYDFDRHVEVLPHNLREFRMLVWVQEIRNIVPFVGGSNAEKLAKFKSMSPKERRDSIGSFDDNLQSMVERLNQDPLAWKNFEIAPRFVTCLDKCYIDINSGLEMFTDLTNSLDAPTDYSFNIKWKKSHVWEKAYLMGFNYDSGAKVFNNDVLNSMANDLLSQAVNRATGEVQGKLEDFKNNILLGNVYGADVLSNMADAIKFGSINALGPLLDKNTNTNSDTNVFLGNMDFNPPSDSQPLQSTNMFEVSDPEKSMGSDNIYPPPSVEEDSKLGNIND